MVKIAIQGHPTRGKEVIQILESLGGNNLYNMTGSRFSHYYINNHHNINGNTLEFVKKSGYSIYTLEEFEKEFPFKVGDRVVCKATQQILHTIVGISLDSCACMQYEIKEDKTGVITHCPTNLLIKYKEMQERNITLTLDKAKEWYKKGGELKEVALQAYSEEELTKVELPKTWEEFCKLGNPISSWRYNVPIKYEAAYKLELLRDCWRQGWKPDWLNGNTTKHTIKGWRDRSSIETTYVTHAFLSFPTYELALKFQECFRDLIEKAGDLI